MCACNPRALDGTCNYGVVKIRKVARYARRARRALVHKRMVVVMDKRRKRGEHENAPHSSVIRSPLHRLQCRKAIDVVWLKAPR